MMSALSPRVKGLHHAFSKIFSKTNQNSPRPLHTKNRYSGGLLKGTLETGTGHPAVLGGLTVLSPFPLGNEKCDSHGS